MPFIVGLTGGIGSGKSSAARIFQKLGAAIVDADEIAHALTGSRGLAVPIIREQFGQEYVRPDHSLDRDRMRQTVFADGGSRRRLEGILHPLIRHEAEREVAAATTPYVVLVVPLLVESPSYRTLVERVVVVDCDPEIQIARTMARSNLTYDAVAAIMATQADRATRLAAADDVVDNSGDEFSLRLQIERLHPLYLTLAQEKK